MEIDINLVQQARAGDEESFSQLYRMISKDLYKMALYTLGNAHDAEDIVSETMIEAYKSLKNLRDEHAFRAWIMKILSIRCKRKIAEYIKGRAVIDIDEMLETPSDRTDILTSSVDKVMVVQALNKLTPQEREIVVLSVLQGYTTKEIAQILSCPHGTVSSKLHRTLIKLRTYLEA